MAKNSLFFCPCIFFCHVINKENATCTHVALVAIYKHWLPSQLRLAILLLPHWKCEHIIAHLLQLQRNH